MQENPEMLDKLRGIVPPTSMEVAEMHKLKEKIMSQKGKQEDNRKEFEIKVKYLLAGIPEGYWSITWGNCFVEDETKKLIQAYCKKIPEALEYGQGIIFTGDHGVGKCLGFNTPVLMFNGSIKKVQDIRVNDLLMGDDNTSRKVKSLATGKEKMYRVRYRDGSYYDINESHILSLVSSNTSGGFKTGEKVDMPLSIYLKLSDSKKRTLIGYKIQGIDLSEKNLSVPPYLLGLYLGDGNKSDGRIDNPDKEIKDYLVDYGVSNIGKDSRNGLERFSVIGLREKLKSLGILGKDKFIPEKYLISSRKQRLELLAGLIDSNGSLNKNGRVLELTQKNEVLSNQIVRLVRSVGIHITIKKIKKGWIYKNTKKENYYYRMNLSRNIENIPIKVKRKIPNILDSYQRSNLHFCFKIEPIKENYYYGFELSGNGRFVLGDFTVTHNTTLSCLIGKTCIEAGYTVKYISIAKIIDILGKTFNSDVMKDRIDTIIERIEILILDDLGKEYQGVRQQLNPMVSLKLDSMLRERINRNLVTIATTNIKLNTMTEKYGKSVMSVIYGACKEIPVLGKDFRQIRGKKFWKSLGF